MAHFWHPEETEKLIELISVRPCIWNPKDVDYTDAKARHEAFDAIAKQMGLVQNLIKSKFKSLRLQFFRIHRDPKKRNSLKKWIFYDSLRFLDIESHDESGTKIESEYFNYAANISNDDEVTVDRDDCIEEERLNDHVDGDEYSRLMENEFQKRNLACPKSLKSKRKPLKLVFKSATPEKDDYTIIGQHVANELRALQHEKSLQQTLKCKILKAIYEANMTLVS